MDATWRPYSNAPSFTLSPGDGFKLVYFKVRNAYGESGAANDAIALNQTFTTPTLMSFSLDEKAAETASRVVTLNNACVGDPTEYMASESLDFSGATWRPYSSAPSFTLSPGNEAKTVYFKARNEYGESVAGADSIDLKLPDTPTNYVFERAWPEGPWFCGPFGIALDASASCAYVANKDSDCVEKITTDGVYVASWGTIGSEPGQFRNLQGIATDIFGNVYVVDSGNYRIQKFTSSGAFLLAWGSRGSGEGQFLGATGIAVDSVGNVYVADSGKVASKSSTRMAAFS